MSKAAPRPAGLNAGGTKAGDKSKNTPAIEARPMAPRRGLFITLMIALALWVAFLLALYVKTVLPAEKAHHPAPTSALPD